MGLALTGLAAAAPLIVGGVRAEGDRNGRLAPLARTPEGRPLVLTFNEDFQSFSTDPRRNRVWRMTYGDGALSGVAQRTQESNGELELYVDSAFGEQVGADDLNPFLVHDGALDITAAPANPALVSKLGGRRFTSGLISSLPSFAQLYGYFEVRAKLPRGKGLWPAIWLLPADMTWPPELDIMESIGDPQTVYLSTHSKTGPPITKEARLADDGFHTFAASWDPRQVVWYIDGLEAARLPTPPDMQKPMYLIINLAVGGVWPGAPDESTRFPAKFAIDYVRAYQFK